MILFLYIARIVIEGLRSSGDFENKVPGATLSQTVQVNGPCLSK